MVMGSKKMRRVAHSCRAVPQNATPLAVAPRDTALADLKKGDFTLIDPSSGRPHHAPDPKFIQKEYLNEMKKKNPDTIKTGFLTIIMFHGAQFAADFIKGNNERLAVIAALILSVAIAETHLDDPEQCKYLDHNGAETYKDSCDLVVRTNAIALVLSLLLICHSTLTISFIYFTREDELAYLMVTHLFTHAGFPTAVLLVAQTCVAVATSIRIGLSVQPYSVTDDDCLPRSQMFAGDDEESACHVPFEAHKLGIVGILFLFQLAWMFCGYGYPIKNNQRGNSLRKSRDFDVVGVSFSDEFLMSLGLLTDAPEDEDEPKTTQEDEVKTTDEETHAAEHETDADAPAPTSGIELPKVGT